MEACGPGGGLHGFSSESRLSLPDDLWAAGTSGYGPIIPHYDGQSWDVAEDSTYAGGYRGAAAGGRSELKISTTDFQVPSACFFQTVTYLPRSV